MHKFIKKMTLVQKGNPKQAPMPTKREPLFTHQKHKDKGQAQLKTNNWRKQRTPVIHIVGKIKFKHEISESETNLTNQQRKPENSPSIDPSFCHMVAKFSVCESSRFTGIFCGYKQIQLSWINTACFFKATCGHIQLHLDTYLYWLRWAVFIFWCVFVWELRVSLVLFWSQFNLEGVCQPMGCSCTKVW